MTETANFFWYGDITTLQIAAIRSFVKHGFVCNLWSYDNVSLSGVTTKDANEILDKKYLTEYKQLKNHIDYESLAIFSDVFRYELLSKHSGWWFDTDCFCLVSVDQFKKIRQNREFVCGLHDLDKHTQTGNGAVLYLNQKTADDLKNQCYQILDKHENQIPYWGALGPDLINNYFDKELFLSKDHFYNIYWNEPDLIVKSKKLKEGLRRVKRSMILHVWNSGIALKNYERGSLLDFLIKQNT